jgi:hypothetical protein
MLPGRFPLVVAMPVHPRLRCLATNASTSHWLSAALSRITMAPLPTTRAFIGRKRMFGFRSMAKLADGRRAVEEGHGTSVTESDVVVAENRVEALRTSREYGT